MSWLIDKRAIIVVICALLPTAVVGFVAYQQTHKIIYTSGVNLHSAGVHDELDAISSLCKDAETGGRGFALTGKEEFLEPYITATSQLDGHIRKLTVLTHNNPKMQQQIAVLGPLIDRRMELLENLIVARKEKGFSAAVQVVKEGEGKRSMDAIRKQIDLMDDDEDKFSNELAGKPEDDKAQTLRVTVVLSLFALALIGCNVFFAKLR